MRTCEERSKQTYSIKYQLNEWHKFCTALDKNNTLEKDEKSDLHPLTRQKECTYRRPKWTMQDGPILGQSNYSTYQHLKVRDNERNWQATGAKVDPRCGTKPFLGRRTIRRRGGGDVCRKYKKSNTNTSGDEVLEIMTDQVQFENCFNILTRLGAEGACDFTVYSTACDHYHQQLCQFTPFQILTCSLKTPERKSLSNNRGEGMNPKRECMHITESALDGFQTLETEASKSTYHVS